ncbi:MAG: succinate dehydrogenase assembly factor 2 [Pseudomonadaceae bacterium]|nr:succinate dehydrogenase assembly factor 2 [Pseudomonadaceae bacterium]
MTTDEAQSNRVFWRSRRGLLELDLLLVPFAEGPYANLAASEQANYASMLDFEDMEIYAWIAGRSEPPEQFNSVIDVIRQHHGMKVDR